MNALGAYFLGVLTIIIVLVSYWFISINNSTFKNLYSNSVCWQICDSSQSTVNESTTSTSQTV